VALENTLAKLVEKIVARQLTELAEEKGMIPWNQFGGRKKRSTVTAVELLTSCTYTAWKAAYKVVSVLSLDITGAFDNVPHQRLLHTMWKKGVPGWILRITTEFLRDRRTKISIPGHISEWIPETTGIPQGSPLSPILFLFYSSELLQQFQEVENHTVGFGFIDDTSLITWGNTPEENCTRLEEAHSKCERWATKHGAAFAPNKYKLIHLQRNSRQERLQTQATVSIQGAEAELCTKRMRLLGFWLDPKLKWSEHIKVAQERMAAAVAQISRLVASTWGPSPQRSKLLYTAMARPVGTYGISAWAHERGKIVRSRLNKIEKVQNTALRKVLGAFKRTPVALLETEAWILPITLYAQKLALNYALKTESSPVGNNIKRTIDKIWNKRSQRPRTNLEELVQRAEEVVEEITLFERHQREETRREETRQHRRKRGRRGATERANQRRRDANREEEEEEKEEPPDPSPKTCIQTWANLSWRKRWIEERNRRSHRQCAAWKGRWGDSRKLYRGLTKAEASVLCQMRTDTIGLRAWLASVGVPGVDKRCDCGETQTVKHVLLHCPHYCRWPQPSWSIGGCEDAEDILNRKNWAREAARWIIQQEVLPQFRVAKEIEERMGEREDRTGEREEEKGVNPWVLL